jgi:two-component system cell cycle sensor histidine kinase PleC
MLAVSFPLKTSSKILNFFYDFFAEKNAEINPPQPQILNSPCAQEESAFTQSPAISPSAQLQPTFSTNFSSCEFLSAITHELKTPLSAIISMSEILAENLAEMGSGNLSAVRFKKNSELLAESKSFVADIAAISADMFSLVHDILDVSKTSQGNLGGKFSVDLNSEINLRDVVKRAVKLNYDYSLKRNVAIKVDISDEVKLVKLDEKRMKQIFTNLISNAVKYSPAGGEVKISAQIKNNFLEICVADQGFGMTQSQIQTAFQKFQTIENPNSGSVDSFGLGLPITKQLVELQNGRIKMNSKVGKGTIVILEFPFITDISSQQ